MQIGTLTIFFLLFSSYIIIAALVYLNIEGLIQKRSLKKINKYRVIIKPLLIKHIDGTISDKELKQLKKYYLKTDGFVAFNEELMAYIKENKSYNPSIVMKDYIDVISKRIKKTRRKDYTTKCYMVFSLGLYRLSDTTIQDFLISMLLSKQIHLRTIALDSIMQIHEPTEFVEGLRVLSENNLFINERSIKEIISHADNNIAFADEMIKYIDIYNEEICKYVIDFLNFTNGDAYKEILCDFLDKELRLEVRISLLRFFNRHIYDQAKPLIIRSLTAPVWEERSIAATAINNYYDDSIYEYLIKHLQDRNWFVRQNASITLIKNSFSKKLIDDVCELNDLYALEALVSNVRKTEGLNRDLVIYARTRQSDMKARKFDMRKQKRRR